jgi:hypothetical protein
MSDAVADFHLPFMSIIRPVMLAMMNENVMLALTLFPQYLLILGICGVLCILYMNYYSTNTTEENVIDHDFLLANATLDAEEEIGSLDDILFGFVIFFYVFSWFFYSYFWALITTFPELTFIL